MAAMVPPYFCGSPTSHVGVPEEKSPQSLTTRSSTVESLYVASLSTTVPRLSVKTPDSEPALVMSTVPTRAGSPGRMSEVLAQMACACLVLAIDSVPVANVVSALAEVAVKSAPEAAVMPTATSTVASAASVRRGRLTRTDMRDIGGDAPRVWVAGD